ncbi:MAG: C25 family cysteine peptidase, partial [Chitinivibrionales bacterium]
MTEIKFIKPVLLCVLLLYTLSLSEISVTSDNTKGCSFSFTLDSLNIEVVERNGKKYSRVGFRSETGTSAETGEPLIPVEEFITGIPDREGFDISFVSERTKRIKLDHPLLLRPEDRYYDPDKGRDYSYSGRWISQPLFSVLRGLDCASFAVKPFIYNPETKTLYILEKGYGNISFETSNEHTGAPVSDGLINDMVINPEGSEHWLARPPEQGLGRIRSSFFERSGVIGKISIGNGTSDFNEGFTDENRMIAITPETINVSGNLNIDEISLYASVKDELDETVPPYDEIPDGVVRIPVIREDLNGNGVFDNNDRIIAYVSSISDYEFSPGPMEYRFDIHEYETDRSYWILRESGSAEMKGFTPPQSEWPVKDTVNKARYGKFYIKNTHLPEKCGSNCEEEYGGRTWAWRKLSNTSGALEMDLDIDDADFTSSLSMQFMFTSLRNGENTTLYFNGETIGDGTDTSWIDLEEWNRDNQRVKAEYFTTKSGCYCQELKSIDVRYTKRLDMSDKKSLSFFSSTNTGVKTYLVENLPDEKVYVLRIPASDSGISLIDTVTGNSSFTWSDTGAVGTRYFLCPESELDTDGFQIESEEPLSNNRHLIQNLRDRSNSSDYLIITPEIFLDQALRLAEHKETLPYFSSPSVVLISDVYREFSGGNMDPSAIRNFLVYVSEYWSSSESSERSIPKYTLLFGNGNYDYKGYTTKEKVRIPPFFIKETSSNDCTDDFFITLDPGEHILSSNSLPDAVIGRVTANTPDEASGFVQKIISLEGDDADYSEWRNSILLVADDDMQGNKHDGINHTGPSEDVKNTIKSVRPEINIKKVYEYEYEWNSVHYKPEATSALINSINSGTAFVNYFGHGSPDEWADERLLQLSDLSRLDNKGRLPVVASFSCSVGRFEVPSQSSLADRLAVINGRGASASFACTRDASASGNRYFALEFFRNYYNTDSSAVSPGDAFLKAKINRYSSGTPREYVLFGDPSVRYHVPEDTVDLEISANGSLISDTLKALQRIKISGKVRSNGEIRKDLGTKSEP